MAPEVLGGEGRVTMIKTYCMTVQNVPQNKIFKGQSMYENAKNQTNKLGLKPNFKKRKKESSDFNFLIFF